MTQKIRHLAIIPDGNRRWAKDRGLPTLEGHKRGFETARKLSKYIRGLGIHTLTLWGFSTENWKRTKGEVGYLMNLYINMLDKYFEEAANDNVKIVHLGREDRIPEKLLAKILKIADVTKKNTGRVLNIGIDYGGHDDVIRAIQKMGAEHFNMKNLTEENLSHFLDTGGQPYPNPDLIIRTGGEKRTSGFMIWQTEYSELIFLDKYFPDLNEKDIDNAISEFYARQRRFGK